MTVCSRFWRAVLRNRRVTASGSRPTAMAMTAAMIELFGVIPTRVSSSMPITAPSSASAAPNSSVAGSNRLGCRFISAMRRQVWGRPRSAGLQTGIAPRRGAKLPPLLAQRRGDG